MRKNNLMLPILAVIVGIAASAFTTANSSYQSTSKADSYYWFNTSGAYQGQATKSNQISATGCDGSLDLCENGYTSSQLVNPSNPQQGVQQGATPKEQIFEHE